MGGGHFQAVDASAGGAFLTGSGQRLLGGARLAAAAADATAIIRETDGSGRILAKLVAKAGEADEFMPHRPVVFTATVHVTVTGAGAVATLFEA